MPCVSLFCAPQSRFLQGSLTPPRPPPPGLPSARALPSTSQSRCHCHHPAVVRIARYLPVEFARDVEQPSRNTTTTQESVALYLQQDPRDLCVLNAGIHDMQCTAEPAPAHPWRNHIVIDDDKT